MLWDARAGVFYAERLAAESGAVDGECNGPARGGELDGVRQEVEANLADGTLVRPELRQVRLERLDDRQALALGPEPHQTVAILDHVGERHWRLMQLVAAGLDATDIEDLVDEIEQVLTALMDVVGIFLVGRVVVRPEDLRAHDLGEAQNGVQRRAQLMTHGGQEAGLSEIGLLGAKPRLV